VPKSPDVRRFLEETAMTYVPPPASLNRLGTIVQEISQSTPINKNITKPPAIFATLPGGQIIFDTDLELDTDGWPDGPDGDPSWQPETSLRYSDNSSLNANKVPYFVLPGPGTFYQGLGVKLGDYAAVIFKNLLAFAVFGDEGPARKLGEGSIQLLRKLGEERMKPNGMVINAGMGPRVITIVFPGSGPNTRFPNEHDLLAAIDSTAKPLFTALGGNAA
jgi:hypothetical protein